ncbi:hypothetical protein Rsub_00177 [Raphidocelis subcapitata]|uniref:ubiquitinyl hydrolase 1 n=1 Tax=Raphidocelis subcapitata TaxID=307507 RepID=A0A2V0NJQ4_9CHLO|nr:hypothetical protein Rsub_00177 [Raphidocelis subcapitata]|eukprot:GBF87466.1 hypothetical protein Rsub_00177 [Raphidocelis subcapitata]
MLPLLLVGPASLLAVVGLVLGIIRWWFSEYPSIRIPTSAASVAALAAHSSRAVEPWWEQQQRALTARHAAAAAAGAPEQQHEQQQQHQHQQERAKGGLAGGDPMVAIAAGGSRCRVCQAPTTTRCGKCKAISYCSPSCQRQDWNRGHKYECSRLQNQHAIAAANKVAAAKGKAARLQQQQHPQQQQQLNGGGGAQPKAAQHEPEEEAPVPQQVIFPYDVFLRLVVSGAAAQRRSAPRGLLNCLLATRPLRSFLDASVHSARCRKPGGAWCLLCELQDLCARCGDGGGGGGDALSVRPLLRNIRLVAKGMAYGRQEDTHELFYSVVNAIESIQLLEAGGKDAYDARSRETTLISHVYGGYVAPNCLALCLKRFGLGRFSKINRRVAVGEALSLAPFMAEGAMDQGPVDYSLYAVIVHLDHMNSTTYGHYVAYVRAGDGRWYLCDDDSVVPVSLGKVLSANAYMLFYERDTPKPAPNPAYRRPAPAAQQWAAAPAAGAAAEGEGGGDGGEAGPAGRGASALFDATPAEPPFGVGLPPCASVPVPVPRLPSSAPAAPAAPPPPAARRLAARHSLAADAPDGASPAEQLQERLSRVSTAPAALVRMAGAADDSASPSPLSTASSDAEAIAAAVGPAGPGDGHGGEGGWAMPSALELLAAARAQAEAAARAQAEAAARTAQRPAAGGLVGRRSSTGGGERPGAAAPAAFPAGMPSPFAAAAAAPLLGAAGGAGPGAASALPAVRATTRLEGGSLVVRASLPGVASSRDVAVTLLPELLQISVPGRFRLLEIDLPPHVTGGRQISRVAVKLFKRTATLRVDMELADGGAGGFGLGGFGGGGFGGAAAAGRPLVVDLWSSDDAARAAAAAAASAASSDAGSEAASECECLVLSGPGGALTSLASLHPSLSETDLFGMGLRATARAQDVLRRLTVPVPVGGRVSGDGGA